MLNWLILLLLSLIWGSSFILMKKSLVVFEYIEVGFFRLQIAFLILLPFVVSSIRKIKKAHIIPLLIVSIIGTVIPAVLFAKAQIFLNSSIAGMLNSLTPMFTLVISIIIFNVKSWSKRDFVGIMIGLFGTYSLLLPKNMTMIDLKYSILLIFATICYALSINTIKHKLHSLKPLDIAVISSCFSTIIPTIYISYNGWGNTLSKIYMNFDSFYYLIILGVICTSFAIIIFNYLIQRSNAIFASSTTYLIPIFAMMWGIIDKEKIEPNEVIGTIFILIGVFVINYKKLE